MYLQYMEQRVYGVVIPIGLAIPFPAMSGALPCIGSYKPSWDALSEAEGRTPIEPGSTAASSVSISPNKFSVTITSNPVGRPITIF